MGCQQVWNFKIEPRFWKTNHGSVLPGTVVHLWSHFEQNFEKENRTFVGVIINVVHVQLTARLILAGCALPSFIGKNENSSDIDASHYIGHRQRLLEFWVLLSRLWPHRTGANRIASMQISPSPIMSVWLESDRVFAWPSFESDVISYTFCESW